MDPQLAKQEAKRELEGLDEEGKKLVVEADLLILRVSSALKEDRYFDSLSETEDSLHKINLACDRLKQILELKKDLQRCPCCRGRGNHMEIKRERDEGVHESLETWKCLTCKGTGKLDP